SVTGVQTCALPIYALAEALTTYGKIGVKVWICKGEVYGKRDLSPNIGGTSASSGKGGRPDGAAAFGGGGDRRGGAGGPGGGSNPRGGGGSRPGGGGPNRQGGGGQGGGGSRPGGN